MSTPIEKSAVDFVEVRLDQQGGFVAAQQTRIAWLEFEGTELPGTRRHLPPEPLSGETIVAAFGEQSVNFAALMAQNAALSLRIAELGLQGIFTMGR